MVVILLSDVLEFRLHYSPISIVFVGFLAEVLILVFKQMLTHAYYIATDPKLTEFMWSNLYPQCMRWKPSVNEENIAETFSAFSLNIHIQTNTHTEQRWLELQAIPYHPIATIVLFMKSSIECIPFSHLFS